MTGLMHKQKQVYLLGYASGYAGVTLETGLSPIVLQQSYHLTKKLHEFAYSVHWEMVKPKNINDTAEKITHEVCTELAQKVSSYIKQKKIFNIIGGDHSSAIGTWSGVYNAIHDKGDLGLIWVDAHMDSHTPETTESGRIHGMPLATLLGHGSSSLTNILNDQPKLKAENVVLIGVRSFERGEAELLKRLQVRIYLMEEVKQRGFQAVWDEAVKLVKKNTYGFGISLDIDSLDPREAPAVDVPEADGLHVKDLYEALYHIAADDKLITTEFVEFNPSKDKNHVTEKVVISLLAGLLKGKQDQPTSQLLNITD